MAKVGGGSAYIRLQTPDDGLNQTLQFWGAQQNKKNADEELELEREGVRKKQEIKDWEDKYGLKEGDFQNKYTGFKSFDDMNTDFSMYATDQYVKLQRQAKEALSNGDLREKSRLEGEMIRLKSAFGEAAKSQEFFANKYEAYQKAATEGKVSGASKDFEDIVQEAILNKNVALRLVDGNLVYTGLKNGKEPFTVPYQDLMDGSFSWYEKQQVSGKGGLVDNVLNDLGTITKENEQGYYKITTQAWDDKIHGKATDDAIEALTGNDEVMGDLLYQFSGGKESKMFGFNEKDYDLVRSKLKSLVRAGYSEKFGSNFNSGKYSADAANARANKKTKDEEDLGVRAWNIDQVRDNNDVSFFTAGDFKWNGNEYEASDAKVVGNDVVIRTKLGDVITIPKNNETALNDLFNAFEGKTLTFDKVQTADKFAWRSARTGSTSRITDVVKKQYSPSGEFIGEETPFVTDLRKLYPNAEIDEAVVGSNAIKVNGKVINLDNLTQDQVEVKLKEALGKNKEKINW